MLINGDISGARPRGFHIPKLSQVRVLTRFYALLPLLSYLNQQVNGVFVFVVPTGQYCVMTGISDTNATFFEVSGRGVVSRKRAAEALRDRIGAGAVVATDKATAYIDVLCDLKVASHESYDSRDRSEGTINRINTVHSLLDSFMARFKGVSTKHLGAYLDWFRWCRTFMATDSRSAESTVARQLANGTCAIRIRDMFNVLPPYMDYWVSRAA